MKKIFLPLLVLIMTFLSCDGDEENFKTDEDYLKGSWAIKKAKTYHYLNGELDNIEESISSQPYSTLNFESNKAVTYSDKDFIQPIHGKWVLNEKILITDLKIELSSSSGSRTFYFFPKNTISLLNETELILKSPLSMETTNSNGDKSQYYSETYLEK